MLFVASNKITKYFFGMSQQCSLSLSLKINLKEKKKTCVKNLIWVEQCKKCRWRGWRGSFCTLHCSIYNRQKTGIDKLAKLFRLYFFVLFKSDTSIETCKTSCLWENILALSQYKTSVTTKPDPTESNQPWFVPLPSILAHRAILIRPLDLLGPLSGTLI